MMKKNGFTLAEVLITLAIIGVVATMTLPALMTNTGEQQYKTGLKKGINTLTEAVQMHDTIDGANFATMTDSSPSEVSKFGDQASVDAQSMFALLAQRCALDYGQTASISATSKTTVDDAYKVTVYFKDGSALMYDPSTAVSKAENAKLQPDGLPLGYTVIYDTNGIKNPNLLSNCDGEMLGKVDTTINTQMQKAIGSAYDISACDDKTKRVIKDQFTVQLRGNVVQPAGKAAVWALQN